jgi:hypothetical protein
VALPVKDFFPQIIAEVYPVVFLTIGAAACVPIYRRAAPVAVDRGYIKILLQKSGVPAHGREVR